MDFMDSRKGILLKIYSEKWSQKSRYLMSIYRYDGEISKMIFIDFPPMYIIFSLNNKKVTFWNIFKGL